MSATVGVLSFAELDAKAAGAQFPVTPAAFVPATRFNLCLLTIPTTVGDRTVTSRENRAGVWEILVISAQVVPHGELTLHLVRGPRKQYDMRLECGSIESMSHVLPTFLFSSCTSRPPVSRG